MSIKCFCNPNALPAVAIVSDCARFCIRGAEYTSSEPFQLAVDFINGDSIALSGMGCRIALARGAVYQISYSATARLEGGIHVFAARALCDRGMIGASSAFAQASSDSIPVTAANSFLFETKEDTEFLLTSATTSGLPTPVYGSISITRVRILEECPEEVETGENIRT